MRWFYLLILLSSCKNIKEEKNITSSETKSSNIEYAYGFDVEMVKEGYILKVNNPWPESGKSFTYYLYRNKTEEFDSLKFDARVKIPIDNLVTTSTTHIPSLDTLGVLSRLVGFPNTNYISTEKAINLVAEGKIKDVGQNESLNTELLININPDALVAFAVKGQNKSIESLSKAGIPVIYNGDWTEKKALGKAEWIKFFGVLFDKLEEAETIFEGIKTEYLKTKKLASEADKRPTVISGALWKDTWYLPSGESWQAQLLCDANSLYIYRNTEGSGSLSLSLESVLNEAKDAEYWIGPAQFTSYDQMIENQSHYAQFKAFKDKQIYTFSLTKGINGGVLYYELAPNRPDIVLKDLVKIFHPELLPNHKFYFFKPLE